MCRTCVGPKQVTGRIAISRTLRSVLFFFVKKIGNYLIDRNEEAVLLMLAIGVWIVMVALGVIFIAGAGFGLYLLFAYL